MSSRSSLPSVCPQCQHPTAQMDPNNRFCPQCRFPLMLVANKYRLIRLMAEGGFGNVYLGHHIHLLEDSSRVIKVIRPEVMNQPGMETRFYREVRITASLSQKNEHIVRIYDDFGEQEQLGFYYVMEYLEGQTLYNLLNGPFDVQQALHIFDQLCDAIAEAHRNSVIHRDLKPDNIMLLQKHRHQDFVKVLDFGIAKPIKGTVQTRLTQGALGTPFYMSPEQCLAKDVGPGSDIYAMGVILYEMLAGKLPFAFEEDAELFAILHAHITAPPVPLREHRPELPEGLDLIVHKALSKKPEERYPSVDAFRVALHPFIDFSASYTALTSSSRLRAISPHTHTPPPAPVEPPQALGTQSIQAPVPVPAVPAHMPETPIPASRTPAPSGGSIGSSQEVATPGTTEWKREPKRPLLGPGPLSQSRAQAGPLSGATQVTPIHLQPVPSMGPLPSGEEGVTTPNPKAVDPRLLSMESPLPPAPKPSQKGPVMVFLLGVLLALGGGGVWYWTTQQPAQRVDQVPDKLSAAPLGRPKANIPASEDAAPAPTPPDTAPVPPLAPRSVDPRPIHQPKRPRPKRTRPKRPRRVRPRRVRPRRPKVRRPKPPRVAMLVPRRPPVRRARRVPPPPPRRPVENPEALQRYHQAGLQLARLFRLRRGPRLLIAQAKKVFQLYKSLGPSQKALASTHFHQSLAHLQFIRLHRSRLRKRKWMSNVYQTQQDELRKLNRQVKRYINRIKQLRRYPLSPYYPCAFFFHGEALKILSTLFQDAVHAPAPEPAFDHHKVPLAKFQRLALRSRAKALRVYRLGLRKSARLQGRRYCVRNIYKGIRQLRDF